MRREAMPIPNGGISFNQLSLLDFVNVRLNTLIIPFLLLLTPNATRYKAIKQLGHGMRGDQRIFLNGGSGFKTLLITNGFCHCQTTHTPCLKGGG